MQDLHGMGDLRYDSLQGLFEFQDKYVSDVGDRYGNQQV